MSTRLVLMKLRDILLNAMIKINPKIEYGGNDSTVLKSKYLSLIEKESISEFIEFCNSCNYSDENIILAISEIIQEFPSVIEENMEEFTNPEFFKIYALELAKKGDVSCLKVHVPGQNTNVDIVCSIIEKYPHFMKDYKGFTFYSVREEQEKKHECWLNYENSSDQQPVDYNCYCNIRSSDEYMYFDEKVLETYAKVIQAGYNPENDLKSNSHLTHFSTVMSAAVAFNPELISLYQPTTYVDYGKGSVNWSYDDDVFEIYLEKVGEINKETLIKNSFMASSDAIMKHLIDLDPALFFEFNSDLSDTKISYFLDKSKKSAKELWDDLLEKKDYGLLNRLTGSSAFIVEMMKVDINFGKYYTGKDDSVFELYVNELQKDKIPLNEQLVKKENFRSSDVFMDAIIKQNPLLIKEYTGKSKEIFENYLNAGNVPTVDIFCYNELFCSVIPHDMLIQIINTTDTVLLGNLLFEDNLVGNLKKVLLETKFKDVSLDLSVVEKYKFDRGKLLANYDMLEEFFKNIDIPINSFIDHSFSSDYDWLNDINKIIENKRVQNFKVVKSHFADKVFESNSEYSYMKHINLILKNYTKYPELCFNILNLNRDLSEEEKEALNSLFKLNVTLEGKYKPMDVSCLSNMGDLLKQNYETKFVELNVNKEKSFKEKDKVKDLICDALFNASYHNICQWLRKYGNTQELRQLQFNNRDHQDLVSQIDQLIIFTSMFETIRKMSDINELLELAKNILDNYENIVNNLFILGDYEQKILKIYELDIQRNLTKLTNIKNKDEVLDKEKTKKYGVEVLDFASSEYVILAHVKNAAEEVDKVIDGKASNGKKFISLSSSSHRNQIYYGGGKGIIFGCTAFPTGSFICSSKSNMASNSYLGKYGSGVSASQIDVEQRGILETSDNGLKFNSEYFCLREGLKFDCIILPGGREATQEEIEIAHKYNLKFVVTQEIGKRIENPKKIEYEEGTEELSSKKGEALIELEEMKKELFSLTQNKEGKKIAVFSDSHALFEPTLAILEDARKNGITEIYSLGDNIGTGPNPKEVLDLLEKYGVKSIMGNHEMYAIGQLDDLKEHLVKTGAYKEAEANSSWTRSKLTKQQIEKIKLYPHMMEIVLGGKKIALCHHTRDYNTGNVIIDPKEFDMVLQGHIHFESEKDDILTLRGAGIGSNVPNQAYYLILTEKPEGGYDIEKRVVKFDIGSLYHDINSSDLSSFDKSKIEGWTGHKK